MAINRDVIYSRPSLNTVSPHIEMKLYIHKAPAQSAEATSCMTENVEQLNMIHLKNNNLKHLAQRNG